MKNKLFSIKNHPDYESTIDEVINENFDKELMDEAIRRTKREGRAEALYVLFKLSAKD